jgi:hypothetical protein
MPGDALLTPQLAGDPKAAAQQEKEKPKEEEAGEGANKRARSIVHQL